MGWRDLLSAEESLVLPWTGDRQLRVGERVWKLGNRPTEHCWGKFQCKSNRTAFFAEMVEPQTDILSQIITGFLVGDHLVADDAHVDPNPRKISEQAEIVHLIEPGLERFVRVSAGRLFDGGPLIYKAQEFPLGPEDEVLSAYLEEKPVSSIKGVTPALDAAFRMEMFQRDETRRRREELERQAKEEQERLQKEARREAIAKQLGDGRGRRELAQEDFEAAARAALAVGGAVFLDHRRARQKQEMVVQFRVNNQRFECTCNAKTLQIIDAGICLNAHYDDPNFEGGTKGDTWFTLESLPGVILQAQRERKLVIFRHVDD